MLRHVLLALMLVFGVSLQATAQSNKANLLSAKFPTAKVRFDKSGAITSIQDRAAPVYSGTALDAATSYLRDVSVAFDGESFALPEVREVAGRTIVRFSQVIGGVPVMGRGLSVFLEGNQPKLLSRASRYAPTLTKEELTPDFDTMIAEVIARDAVQQSDNAQSHSKLVLLPTKTSATLVYSVVTQEGLSYYRVFINAKSGAVLWKQDLLLNARAKVYNNNPGAASNAPLVEVDLPALRAVPSVEEGLLGDFVNAFSCTAPFNDPQTGCTIQGVAFSDANDDLLFDPVLLATAPGFNEDPFSQVHMFFHVDRIHNFFEGFGATDEPGQITLPGGVETTLDAPLLAITDLHFAAGNNGDFDNAFFAGSAIVFGNGSRRDFSYDAEVIYHEYGHAVFSFLLGGISLDELGLDTINGGMNEGTADVFSTLFTNNPALGEYVSESNNGIRNVENQRVFPGSLDGETHDDGEIWGGVFWELKTQFELAFTDDLGSEAAVHELLGRIYVATIFGLPSLEADFGEAALVMLDVTEEIGNEDNIGAEASQIVLDVVQARGLLNAQLQPAQRIVPIDPPLLPASPTCAAFFGPGIFCQFGFGQTAFGVDSATPVPGPLQYTATVPPGQELVADVDVQVFSGTKNFDLYINEGSPVAFDYVFFPDLEVNVTAQQTISNPTQLLLQNPTDEPKTFFIAFGILSDDPQGFGVFPVVSDVALQDFTPPPLPPEVFFRGGDCSVSQENTPVVVLLLFAVAGLYLITLRRRSVR
jgi:hypothetical protein